MDTILSSLKSSFLKLFLVILVAYFIPFSDVYAARGCCSRHGGVAGCNSSTGYLMCKDGVQSHSCTCSGTTEKTTTKPKSKSFLKTITDTVLPSAGTTTTTTTKTTKTTKQTAAEKKAAAKKATVEKKASTRGCCKGHGGVKGCDPKTKHQKCKDGTISGTCTC